MLGAERLLADRERALVERACAGEIALVQEQVARLLRLVADVGMLGAERLLADRQRALVERPRAGEIALGLQQAPRGC